MARRPLGPHLLKRFGGHAAAACVTILEEQLGEFEAVFEAVARDLLSPADLTRTLETDRSLESGYLSLESARLLRDAIWGQGFPAPMFSDVFEVDRQKLLKDKHLKLTLKKGRARFDAIRFNCAESAPERIHAAYRLDVNEWNGVANVQLIIEHFEPA